MAAQDKWQTNFCICTPFVDCLFAWFAPCFIYGQTADRLRDPSMQTANQSNDDCTSFACLHCITGCGFIMAMKQREQIRTRYAIKGDTCGDCCATYCCLPCTLMQHDNEVKRREAAHLATGTVTQGYQAPAGMAVPAQQQQQQQQQLPPPQYQQPQYQQQQYYHEQK